MGFFKDFADDLSDAVDELMPVTDEEDKDLDEEETVEAAKEEDTIESDLDVEGELNKLDGLLEKVAKKVDAQEASAPVAPVEKKAEAPKPVVPAPAPAPVARKEEAPVTNRIAKETLTMDNETMMNEAVATPIVPTFDNEPASDENAVITNGMRITGDLESTGSIEVEGTINGNVRCNGKLTVTGVIQGNTTSSEFFADSAKMEGEVSSSGTVKIGVGSVIIGNITASSAVIAGAVKGDIDVQGPVVVDTSAVVMGNIKSRSVQINNGAVIEGFCSQAYAEVDVASVFA